MAACLAALIISGCAQQRAKPNGKVKIEVSVFQGGFGIDFHKRMAREYERLHPNVTVDLWGDPRNSEKLRPRFVAGDPPDVVFGQGMPFWTLVDNGQVYPLNKALRSPASDSPHHTWYETFLPGALEPYSQNGKYYAVVVEYSSFGFYYNVKMFKKFGWRVPATWSELLALCEKCRAKGIDPIAFQGRYPGYINSIFEDLVQRIGGMPAWTAMQNMKPGAWESPAVVRALTFVYDLRSKQYIPDMYMGLSHTESQMRFVQGKAAMVTCGTWLKTEMASNLPPGFEMAFFPTPMVAGGKGDASAMPAGGSYWFVPAKAKHPEIGADFLKFLTSVKHAREFVKEKSSLLAIQGCDVDLPPDLASVCGYMKAAKFTYCSQVTTWYPSFGQFYTEGISDLMNLKQTPREVARYLETAAARVRSDPRIKKRSVTVAGGTN